MKIKLLVGRVSAEGSHAPGDEINVSDREAYTLITTGQAEPKVKKHFSDLEKRIAKAKVDNEEKQAKLLAVQKEQELRDEAEALLGQLAAIVATLETTHPEYRQEFIESFQEKFAEGAGSKEGEE
ncbi:hypothetical protein [Sulfurovum mangrovi]|uniref:hypothetical protein n=1 Tax=Sulfurovum mangrovi TaxID=2893889 RepID=UPI001E55FA97|nr:hypothetical protein [Sulfurovum mangrovi]UFH59831.1 hypothetical protein LN246_03060 [Sulfurovum mangrovi]UFH59882.1 hypothetical protein LN246_03320 [Sulfurovum mangrovi]